MDSKELVRTLCKAESVSQVELSKRLGRSNLYIAAGLSKNKGFSITTLVRICDALEYDLIARSRIDGEEYVIDE